MWVCSSQRVQCKFLVEGRYQRVLGSSFTENQGEHKQISLLTCAWFSGKPKQNTGTNQNQQTLLCALSWWAFLVMVSVQFSACISVSFQLWRTECAEHHRLLQLPASNILLDSCHTNIQRSGEESEFHCFELGSLIIFYQFVCLQTYKFMCKVPDKSQRPQKSETWSLWVAI